MLRYVKQPQRVFILDSDMKWISYHEQLFLKKGIFEKLTYAQHVETGLSYLATRTVSTMPHLICMEVDLPHEGGWTFLDAYHQLSEEKRLQCNLFIFSYATNPLIRQRALRYPEVKGFHYKFFNANDPLMAQRVLM